MASGGRTWSRLIFWLETHAFDVQQTVRLSGPAMPKRLRREGRVEVEVSGEQVALRLRSG